MINGRAGQLAAHGLHVAPEELVWQPLGSYLASLPVLLLLLLQLGYLGSCSLPQLLLPAPTPECSAVQPTVLGKPAQCSGLGATRELKCELPRMPTMVAHVCGTMVLGGSGSPY